MGLLDKIFGREPAQGQPGQTATPRAGSGPRDSGPQDSGPQDSGHQDSGPAGSEDERAIARYRYLLRTAPPEKLEQAHTEAFARLSPDQREQVLAELSQSLPPGEAPGTSDPQAMARAATRGEMQRPGYLERTFANPSRGGGMGMGGMFAGSMLGTIAGVVVGSAIAQSLFDGYADSPEAQGDPSAGGESSEGGSGEGDAGGGDTGGGDAGGEAGGTAFGGGDSGGGGDFGGDFGGI